MTDHEPLLRRVDHVIVRTEPEAHAPLLVLLRDGFGLPAPWPLSRHAAFASGGVLVECVLELEQGALLTANSGRGG